MSLKVRVLSFVACLFLLLGILNYGIQRFIVIPEFERLEKAQALDNLERSIHAIRREVLHLNSSCRDWSIWDDTYGFVQDGRQEFVRSNLAFSTFVSLKINLLYLCDSTGKVVWGEIHDLKTGGPILMKDFPADVLPINSPLFRMNINGPDLEEVSVAGVISTGRGPMLVSSRPVLKSDGTGPMKGFVIMGKFLDKAYVDMLMEQTRVNFSILVDHAEESALRNAESLVDGMDIPYRMEYPSSERLDIHALYPDITGKPAFIIRNSLSRDIMKGRLDAVRYAQGALIAAGILVAILTLLFLEHTLLHPVTNLTRHVLSITETGNFSLRLRVNRRDEIGTLAREFDRMLGRISEMSTMMEGINDQLIEDLQKRMDMERKLQEANDQLEKLASMDGLTGISNRRRFDEYLNVEWRRGIRDREPLSLIILDVDHFKTFNDTYGHQAGDECLRAIAGIIDSRAKRTSDLAARYGGEEFALVLPSTDSEGALLLAESIRTAVEGFTVSHEATGAQMHVTLSAGVSTLVPDKASSPEDLIRLADTALYEAKTTGRNRSVARKDSQGFHAVQGKA